MALTLEAALVLPLSISLVFSVIPPAVQRYRQIEHESAVMKQAIRMDTDAQSLYSLMPVKVTTAAGTSISDGRSDGRGFCDVLLTSPKMMFCLVTAVIDDIQLLGFAKP